MEFRPVLPGARMGARRPPGADRSPPRTRTCAPASPTSARPRATRPSTASPTAGIATPRLPGQRPGPRAQHRPPSSRRPVARHARACVRDFEPDVVIASQHLPAGHLAGAPPGAPRPGASWCSRCTTCGRCRRSSWRACRRWHPFIMLLPGGRKLRLPRRRRRRLDAARGARAHGRARLALRQAAHRAQRHPPDDWRPTPRRCAATWPARWRAARAAADHRRLRRLHGRANALDTLLDAAALLRGDRSARCLRAGGRRPLRGQLQARLRRGAACANVHSVAADPQGCRCRRCWRRFDIAYIGWQRVPIYRFGIAPNKLMDYMMAARAVLHSVEAGNDPVAEAGCGLTVAPQDAPRGRRRPAEADAAGARPPAR